MGRGAKGEAGWEGEKQPCEQLVMELIKHQACPPSPRPERAELRGPEETVGQSQGAARQPAVPVTAEYSHANTDTG